MTTVRIGAPETWPLEWAVNHRPEETKTRRNVRIAFTTLWAGLSASICIPSLLAIASERTGSEANKIGADFSTVGTSICWSSLTFYPGYILIREFTANKAEIEVLFKDDTPAVAKGIMIGLGITFALLSRIVSVAEGVMFTKNKAFGLGIGIESAVAEAGLPALGFFLLIRDLTKYIRNKYILKGTADHSVEEVRNYLLKVTEASIQYSLKSTDEERRAKFKVLYEAVHEKDVATIKQEWQSLLKEMVQIYQEGIGKQNNCLDYVVREVPIKLIQASCATNAIPLFVMDALLAGTVYQMIHANEQGQTLGMIMAFFPLIYLAPKMMWDAGGNTCNMLYDMLGGERNGKAFANTFYPRISGVIKILAAAMSTMQFDEQIALSKKYTKEGTWQYKFLAYGNIVACSLLITASFYEIIDKLFEKYTLSSRSSQEVKNAAYLKERLDRLGQMFREMRTDYLDMMLKSIDDEDLKKQILSGKVSVQEMVSSLTNEEERPLLDQV